MSSIETNSDKIGIFVGRSISHDPIYFNSQPELEDAYYIKNLIAQSDFLEFRLSKNGNANQWILWFISKKYPKAGVGFINRGIRLLKYKKLDNTSNV